MPTHETPPQPTAPFPGFTHAETATGTLRLRWAPPEPARAQGVARAHAVVVLRPLTPEDERALWEGAFDHDAIRFPVDPSAGEATLFAPPDRVVTVGLAFRDGQGRLVPTPTPHVLAAAPLPCETPSAPPLGAVPRHSHGHTPPHGPVEAGGEASPAPERRAPLELGEPVEMVFAQPPGGPPPPDLGALARRVAAQLGGAPPEPPAPRPPAGSFGALGRWYPVHLVWPEPEPGTSRELRLVRRARFMDVAEVAGWATAPPRDAVTIPGDVDGLIDATVPQGQVRFYAVLAGPAPWRPLPLSPAPPPFAKPHRPHLLGDVVGVLEAAVRARLARLRSEPSAGPDRAVQIELLEALARRCEPAAREALMAELQAIRAAPLF